MEDSMIQQHQRASTSREYTISVMPPPAEAMLPPPRPAFEENSSGSSSSRKRKRDIDKGSEQRHMPPFTPASTTSDFSNATKAKVKANHEDRCWHCSANSADVCHVIGSRDRTFENAIHDSLIDFTDKRHIDNAIALCPLCHRNYDDPYSPSFFFLPVDLDYFIAREKEDRKRRYELGCREGKIPARLCPTAEAYQAHQMDEGIPGSGFGGLYTRLVLRDFIAQYPGRKSFVPGPSEYGAIRAWKGSPMAALHRAVVMMRTLNLRGIPQDIRNALRELQDLYTKPVELGDDSTEVTNSTRGTQLESEITQREPGELESDKQSVHGVLEETNNKQVDGGVDECGTLSGSIASNREAPSFESDSGSEGGGANKREDAADSHSPSKTNFSRFWCWGPNATSQDAIKFAKAVI